MVPLNEVPPALGVKGSGKSGLERHGLVTVRPDPGKRSIKVAYLSVTGQRVRDTYPILVRDVESDWRARFGTTALAAVRDALESALPTIDPATPDALIATYVQS